MTDHRSVEREIIEHALNTLIPGATPAFLTVQVTEHEPHGGTNTWSGSPAGLADRIVTALYGRRRSTTPDTPAPLAQAEDAKRRRDLAGEIGALLQGGADLEAAPWHPSQPGDLVHIAYSAVGPFQAYGETYVIEAADVAPFLNMRLLHHSPNLADDLKPLAGCYATEETDEPLAEAWFEAGASRITVIRDGAVIPNQAARR